MAIKNTFLFLNDNKKLIVNNNLNNGIKRRCFNLNLNQNLKCSFLNPVQPCNKTYNEKYSECINTAVLIFRLKKEAQCEKDFKIDKKETAVTPILDSTVSDNYKEKLQSWNKFSNNSNLAIHNDEDKEGINWKEGGSFSINSTLLLHITAYENSFEPATFDSFNGNSEGLEMDKFGSIKKHEIFDPSTFVIQNSFEFPRQQTFVASTPEVSQFTTSQQLLNPSETSTTVFRTSQQLLSSTEASTIVSKISQKLLNPTEKATTIVQSKNTTHIYVDPRPYEALGISENGIIIMGIILALLILIGNGAALGYFFRWFHKPLSRRPTEEEMDDVLDADLPVFLTNHNKRANEFQFAAKVEKDTQTIMASEMLPQTEQQQSSMPSDLKSAVPDDGNRGAGAPPHSPRAGTPRRPGGGGAKRGGGRAGGGGRGRGRK